MTPNDAYHHGNLRRALMDGALAVIAERGIEGLSLREVAARAGVSHAAPYHHFADRAALIQALADEAVGLIDERMATAETAAGDDPLERLIAIGMAYVLFADERPDYYAAFTAPELHAARNQPIPSEGQAGGTWMRLVRAVTDCQAASKLPAGDPVILSLTMWSLVHGLAELWRTGPLRFTSQSSGGLEPTARAVLLAAAGSIQEASGSTSRPARGKDDC